MAFFVFLVVGNLARVLGPPPGTPGQLCFELTFTRKRAEKIIDAWKRANALKAARNAIYADFPFLVAYGVMIATAGSAAGRGFDEPSSGAAITWIGLLAPLFDAVENVGLLRMLKRGAGQPLPAITSTVSAVKWLLLAAAIVLL